MNRTDEIVGGKWWKIDFHIHSPASFDYGHVDANQKNVSPEQFLSCCMRKELDCIVIADHNTFQWISKLREALQNMRKDNVENFREIIIFPGIEINAQGNVHLLGIFDPGVDNEKLFPIIGKIGYDEIAQTTKKSLQEVMQVIIDNDGIVVPAHVDKQSGLFHTQPDIKRIAYSVKGLLALEMINPSAHDGAYCDANLHLSHILGSDSHTVETIGDKFTWVKMGTPNIEALRLALHDGEGAIQRSDQLDNHQNPNNLRTTTYIKDLTIEQGRYIGKGNLNPYRMQFSPFLNTLIGGRGAGKSTIVNFLRLILKRQDELPQDLGIEFGNFSCVHKTRNDVGMLETDTKLFLTMIVDGVEHKLKWQDNEVHEFDDGSKKYVQISDISSIKERFPVEIFSQKQLYEITRDTSALLRIIDNQWDSATWKLRLEQAKEKYKELCQQIRGLQLQKIKYERLKQNLQDVLNKLSIFENDNARSLFQENHSLNEQVNIVQNIYEQYRPIIESIHKIRSVNFPSIPEEASLLQSNILEKLKTWGDQFKNFETEFQKLVLKYPVIVMLKEHLLDYIGISKLLADNGVKLERLLQDLKDVGVYDVNKHSELIEERTKIQNSLSSYLRLDSKIEDVKNSILEQFDYIHNLIFERFSERSLVIDSLNKSSDVLKIKLSLFGNLQENNRFLREIIRKKDGFDSDIFEEDTENNNNTIIYKICHLSDDISLTKKITFLKEEKMHLLKKDGRYSKKFINYLTGAFEKFPDIRTDIAVWIPEDNLELEIKIDDKFKSVEMGSRGQRTSAILALILNTSKSPIIIDQPEDDLDTRNITSMVVESLNKIKNHTQVILATHNPNIVVNANAEWIVSLDFKNGQIQNMHQGALQEHAIRDSICDIMEGGREALEKRYYRIIKALS